MWTYTYTDELYHYGVVGMKWGVRRQNRQMRKMMKDGAIQFSNYRPRQDGKKGYDFDIVYNPTPKKSSANRVKTAKNKPSTLISSKETVQKTKGTKEEFRNARSRVGESRSRGAKVATNLLAGAFANRTYNSVIASGGSKQKARIVTGVTAVASMQLAAPIGHLITSSIYARNYSKED